MVKRSENDRRELHLRSLLMSSNKEDWDSGDGCKKTCQLLHHVVKAHISETICNSNRLPVAQLETSIFLRNFFHAATLTKKISQNHRAFLPFRPLENVKCPKLITRHFRRRRRRNRRLSLTLIQEVNTKTKPAKKGRKKEWKEFFLEVFLLFLSLFFLSKFKSEKRMLIVDSFYADPRELFTFSSAFNDGCCC